MFTIDSVLVSIFFVVILLLFSAVFYIYVLCQIAQCFPLGKKKV